MMLAPIPWKREEILEPRSWKVYLPERMCPPAHMLES